MTVDGKHLLANCWQALSSGHQGQLWCIWSATDALFCIWRSWQADIMTLHMRVMKAAATVV